MKYLKHVKVLIYLMLFSALVYSVFLDGLVARAAEDPINEAKNAVVEINYGIKINDGNFYKIKHASGIIVSNQENKAYILTAYNSVYTSEKKKKEFCSKHGISTENNSLTDTINIVTKGDVVAAPASILAFSKDKNFCVIETDNGLADKSTVRLGLSRDLVTGDKVYALGFPENAGKNDAEANRYTEYTAMDVVVKEGAIQDITSNKKGVGHLQHSAVIDSGNHGGPLLNTEGYLVGINNKKLSDFEHKVFYSLPIDEIREILDNYDVPYVSIDKEASLAAFNRLLEECESLLVSKDYKTNSKEKLQAAVENARTVAKSSNPPEEQIADASRQLEEGKAALVAKMKTTRKVIIILGVIALFLFVWVLRLLIWKSKADKSMKNRPVTPSKPGRKRRKKNKEDIDADIERYDVEATRIQTPGFARRGKKATICHVKSNERVVIKKPEFHIGKRSDNDFVIRSDTVSRQHACIFKEGDHYYIKDLNSSNGTMVNGNMIKSGVPVEINDGTRIVLADQEFFFEVTK